MKRLSILLLLSLVALSLYGQSTNHNYVRTRTYTNEAGSLYLDHIEYYDGYGQPWEVVQKGITPNKQDIINYREYDGFGTYDRTWLPALAASGNNGAFVSQITVVNLARSSYDNDYDPYIESKYESSSLRRPVRSQMAGADMRSVSTDIEYLSNSTATDMLNCRHFKVSGTLANTTLLDGGNYATGLLNVTRVTDEDGRVSLEFTNKQGQLVLSRRMNYTDKTDTYYVYDDYGNLCYVLPPALSTQASITTTGLDQFAYQYKYDHRNRCIEKKLPGAQKEEYVYDKADRLKGIRDSYFLQRGSWKMMHYDTFDRCTRVMKFNQNISRASLQELTDHSTTSSQPFPQIGASNAIDIQEMIYDSPNLTGKDAKLNFAAVTGVVTATDRVARKGFLDYEKKAILTDTESDSFTYIQSRYYYDYKGQLIQSVELNHLGGVSRISYKYDFVGNVTAKHESHQMLSSATADILLTNYTYDHAGRLTKEETKLNNGTAALINYAYDELGRLNYKTYANNTSLKEEYNYNVRGWETSRISPLFEMRLRYNNPVKISPQFGGNISEWEWAHKNGTGGGTTIVNTSYALSTTVLAIPNANMERVIYYTRNHYDMYRAGFPHFVGSDGLIRPEYLIKQTATETFYYMPLENDVARFMANMIGLGVAPQTTINDSRIADVPKKTEVVIANEVPAAGALSNDMYAFRYDQLSRLTASNRYTGTAMTSTNANTEKGITYDKNGNITKLQRYNNSGTLSDNFTYNYTGNRLMSLSGSHSATYTYDNNGNMTKDGLENTTLTYNFLNLITQVKSGTTVKAHYRWLADGRKAGVNTNASNTGDGFEYLGSLVYKRTSGALSLESAAFGGGRIYKATSTYTPNYFLTDHLGSPRVVVDGSGNVLSRHDYMPFGQSWENPSMQTGTNRYLYNGKEKQGIGYLDYGWRMSSTRLGRWTSMDAMLEKFVEHTPYNFTLNNPARFIDFDGRDIYLMDPEGNMVLALKTSNVHSVYTHDGQGNITGNMNVSDGSILNDLYIDRGDYNGHYAISGSHEAGDLFLFFANNTDVEWGLDGYQGKKGREYVLRTSHKKDYVNTYSTAGYDVSNQFFAIHSHPSPNGTKGGSGYWGGKNGDAFRVDQQYREAENRGTNPPAHYVYHKHSKTLYQYTPSESSIYIKRLNNNKSLRFLVPNR